MIKKTITYTDYNDVERTEDFHFNLTSAEAMEWEASVTGGLSTMVEKVIAAQDTPTLFSLFKEIIMKSYGEKSADGRRFVKSEELSRAFSQTEAYVKLYMELATDAEAAAEFVNGITPKKESLPNTVANK